MNSSFFVRPIIFLVCLNLISCNLHQINSIEIGPTLYTHTSYAEIEALKILISKSLEHDKAAFVQLKNFPNGGGASSYDLGFIITQIIYKMGEDDFVKMVNKMTRSEIIGLEGLIAAGLEYSDNDQDGKMDNKHIAETFPRISAILNLEPQ